MKIKTTLSILVVAVAVTLTACVNPSFSGDGNEFVVLGKVTYVGNQSIGADVYRIQEEHGEAKGWFEDGVYHRIHDNCDCKETWLGYSRTKLGHVEDSTGQEIDIQDLEVGACVRFTGKIHANKEGKTTVNRPVYHIARVIPCVQSDY